ncbi:MAG: antibiotic biosynthesis monooxygenase [Deltaproteobacteria bacterium]|nr:antibiotic biosynthesis monooxygenase [Deltaproteobacteria bacterium]
MAVRVVVEANAKPGTGNDLVTFFKSILAETRAHDGCTSVDALQNCDNADNVLLAATWETRAQYEKYLAWQRERGVSAKLIDHLAETPTIRFFDVTGA